MGADTVTFTTSPTAVMGGELTVTFTTRPTALMGGELTVTFTTSPTALILGAVTVTFTADGTTVPGLSGGALMGTAALGGGSDSAARGMAVTSATDAIAAMHDPSVRRFQRLLAKRVDGDVVSGTAKLLGRLSAPSSSWA